AALASLLVVFFLANLPAYLSQLRTVCLKAPCARWQLTPTSAHVLGQLHVTPTPYALVSLVVGAASVLVWFAVGAIIAWRRSRQWMALLTSLLLLAQGVINMGGAAIAPLY